MATEAMVDRDDVLEGMRMLCAENYTAAMRMSEQLKRANVIADPRPFAEQRRYSELAFIQLLSYLKANGWHGIMPEDDVGKAQVMRDIIFKGQEKVALE